MTTSEERRIAPGFYLGIAAAAACTAFLITMASVADAAPLPGTKACSKQSQCGLLRKPDRRVLPAGVMFARVASTKIATDAIAGSGERKAKREAKREARKEKRAARRAKRKSAEAS